MEPANGDPATAAAAALSDANAAARRIAQLSEPFDAFDILENVRLSQEATNPDTYKETEHEGTAAVIELCALVLSTRGDRVGTLPDADGHRARADGVMDEIVKECGVALSAGAMFAFFETMREAGPEGSIQLGAVLREIYVRSLAYPHMVEEMLSGLFGDPSIEADCRAAMGCTVAEILRVIESLTVLHQRHWQQRFSALTELAELARAEFDKAALYGDGYEISPEAKASGISLLDAAWADPADASTSSLATIASEAGLEVEIVRSAIDVFSLDMASGDPASAARTLFDGSSPLRTRPILRAPGNDFVVVHTGLLLPAVRERVEQKLKEAGRWDRYSKRRGAFLEGEALALLEPHFPGSVVRSSIEYFVPNPAAVPAEVTPAAYTKFVEGDGLIIVDDVALIVEAKAGALSELSRTGDRRRLTQDLRKIVAAASEQAERLRERVRDDRGLRLRGGAWIDLSNVREIHTIAVSLDDLSGIATITSELVRAGILASPDLPWTVSLHDLRIVAELVERPAEFLLYIRRRTEPNVTRRFLAVDELDFFLEFYASGLYVEPNPERILDELPQFGEPGVAAKRRYNKQGIEFLTSRTDQLDAGYFVELGIRQSPAPKPRLNANQELLTLVDAVAIRREPGWLSIGTALLDADGPTQRKFARYSRGLVKRSRNDGKPHSLTIMGGTSAVNSFVIVWASLGADERESEAEKVLTRYVTAKKHQVQVSFGAGLLFDSTDPMSPTFTIYDNRRPGRDEELDQLGVSLQLKPVDRATQSDLRLR